MRGRWRKWSAGRCYSHPDLSLLTPIPAVDLHKHWDWLRAGLERVRAKVATEWIPEDIWQAIRSGAAGVSIIADGAGFIVLQRQERARGPCLFIWVVEGELAQYEQAMYAELEHVARDMKAPTIEMHSPRKGWAQRGFWMPTNTVYIHEVS